jgi:transposase
MLKVHNPESLTAAILQAVQSSQARLVHRLHCLLWVAHGYSCRKVAQWFGYDAKTLERWLHAFVQGELEEKPAGRRPALNSAQMAQLAEELKNSPKVLGYSSQAWTGKLLAEHLERRYRLVLSLRQCQRLLGKLRQD